MPRKDRPADAEIQRLIEAQVTGPADRKILRRQGLARKTLSKLRK
jgi:hypothetical protein